MDLMQRRRELMQMQVLDTSPVILQMDARYNSAGEILGFTGRCVTKKYDCLCDNDHRSFMAYGIESTTINYKNNEFYDYWNNPATTPTSNTILAKYGTDQMAFTLVMSLLDDCYVVQNNSGIILFAGKNSIYYGHRNISELS